MGSIPPSRTGLIVVVFLTDALYTDAKLVSGSEGKSGYRTPRGTEPVGPTELDLRLFSQTGADSNYLELNGDLGTELLRRFCIDSISNTVNKKPDGCGSLHPFSFDLQGRRELSDL